MDIKKDPDSKPRARIEEVKGGKNQNSSVSEEETIDTNRKHDKNAKKDL